jgi:hypothetical protein
LVIEYLNRIGIFMYDELIEDNNTGALASAPVLLSRVVKFS